MTTNEPIISTFKIASGVSVKREDLEKLNSVDIVMTLPTLGKDSPLYHVIGSKICVFKHDTGDILALTIDGHKNSVIIEHNQIAVAITEPVTKRKKLIPQAKQISWQKAVNHWLITNPGMKTEELKFLPDGKTVHPLAQNYVRVSHALFEFLKTKQNLGVLALTAANRLTQPEKDALIFELLVDPYYPNEYVMHKTLDNFLTKFKTMSVEESNLIKSNFMVHINPLMLPQAIHSGHVDPAAWSTYLKMKNEHRSDIEVAAMKYKAVFTFFIEMKIKVLLIDGGNLSDLSQKTSVEMAVTDILDKIKIDAHGKPIMEVGKNEIYKETDEEEEEESE